MSGEIEITELVKFEVERIDAVESPANGFPVLMMKGLGAPEPAVKAAHPPYDGTHSHPHPANGSQDGDEMHSHEHTHDGDADHGHSHAEKSAFDREAARELVKAIVGRKVDEAPDIAGGTAVLAQIADLIIAEAQELKAGQAGEIADIRELACAAEMIWCWRTGEEAVSTGSVMPATALAQSAADVEKGGDAPGDGSKPYGNVEYADPGYQSDKQKRYPLDTEKHIRAAWSYINQADNASKYSAADLAKVKSKIRAAMKRIGADVDDDTSKSRIAEEVTDVDTVTQDDSVAKAVEALAKVEALEGRVKAAEERAAKAEEQVAKFAAMPRIGGPVMTAAAPQKAALDSETWAAKARYFREMADTVSQDPKAAADYRQLARQAEEHLTVS